MRCAFSLLTLVAASATATTTPLAAQTPAPGQDSASAAVTAAAASIRAADLARHRDSLTAASPRGGTMPSAGLEAAARYLAAQFQALGVRPHGDQTQAMDTIGSNVQFKMVTVTQSDGRSSQVMAKDTSFLQRYPLPGNMTVHPDGARLTFTVMLQKQGKPVIDANQLWPTEAAKRVEVPFAANAFFAGDSVPQSGGRGPWASYAPPQAFVVAGPHTEQTVRAAQLQDKFVFYVPHAQADSATRQQILDRLRTTNHVVLLSTEDSTTFAGRRRAATARPVLLVDRYMEDALGLRYWAVELRAAAIKELLTVAGIDPAAARLATAPTVRMVPSVVGALDVQPGQSVDSASAPNVIGFIPGRDTTVRNEYIVYSAPLEHADGLLALANAFSQPGAMPRRSVLFVALSGRAPDFAGATYFVTNPPVSAADLTINIALGPLGRSASDSVTIAGLRDFTLASRPDWLASQHPELGLVVADGGTILTADAHHLAFIRRAVPSLYVASGAEAADTSTPANLEQTARALRLTFYVGRELANAPRATTWTSASRRERVRFLGR